MKTKHLYHGSSRKLEGNKLIPKKPSDLGNNLDNKITAIYASDIKEEAIAMAILSSNGVKYSGLRNAEGNIDAVIYKGWPEDNIFYLYTLPYEDFQNKPKGSHQWVSVQPTRPTKIEEFKFDEYKHLIRKATQEEADEWFRKFRIKK